LHALENENYLNDGSLAIADRNRLPASFRSVDTCTHTMSFSGHSVFTVCPEKNDQNVFHYISHKILAILMKFRT